MAGDTLKHIDTFTHLGSDISSAENYLNIRIGKAWGVLKADHCMEIEP